MSNYNGPGGTPGVDLSFIPGGMDYESVFHLWQYRIVWDEYPDIPGNPAVRHLVDQHIVYGDDIPDYTPEAISLLSEGKVWEQTETVAFAVRDQIGNWPPDTPVPVHVPGQDGEPVTSGLSPKEE